jgi:peptidoglycan/LPS O-acetylase OafA/YrhL
VSLPTEAPATTARVRLHAIDWLRALAVLGVFAYHTLRPFTTDAWHVTSEHPSGAVDALLGFVDPWGVAFFFMIAGASAFLALGWRTPGRYVRERLERLLVPLVVAYLLLSPVQAFIEETHFGRYEGSFVGAVPLFFEEIAADLSTTLGHPLLVGRSYHLWFVIFLLWFALLGLPAFVWLRGPGGRLSAWLGERAGRRGAVLWLAVPISVLPLAVFPVWPETEDWGTFAYLFGFFVAGGVLMSDRRLTDAVRRDVRIAFAVALTVDLVMIATGVVGFVEDWADDPSYSPLYVWSYFLVAVQAWAWVLAFLGLGLRAGRFSRPLPRSVGDAAMPFFIVHQPVILGVAFAVVRWGAPALVEWVAIAAVSFAVSAAIAVGLARLPVVSTMFGVKTRREPPGTGGPRRASR